MKYTAGELRKMNGRKCKLKDWSKPDAEGEIYVVDWSVSFVTNDDEYRKWTWLKKDWYEFSWHLYRSYDDDLFCTTQYDSITFLDEHQNIYYDDNGEEIREWDWVLVWADSPIAERIFLCKIPRCRKKYICVDNNYKELYNTDRDELDVSSRTHCIKYKEPEKKLRELMLTDEEYEEVKNKYK